MSSPLVSVITTTYNWPAALELAMTTVLGQTFEDFEYLVVGDCCTDETEDVVRSFEDHRIRWHNLAENTGNQSGVNRIATAMAQGRYIAYLNHDDLWFPDHLQSLVEPMEDDDIDMVTSLALDIKPPGNDYRGLIGLPWINPDGEVTLNPMTSAALHTAAVTDACGGWQDWRETRAIPTLDFFRRVREHRHRYAVSTHLTVLKFHSGNRKNCYREKTADEQAAWLERMRSEPQLRYREVMKALAYRSARESPPEIALPGTPQTRPPGWRIEQWRRIRGLEAMLDLGDEAPDKSAQLPRNEDSVVAVSDDDLAVMRLSGKRSPNN